MVAVFTLSPQSCFLCGSAVDVVVVAAGDAAGRSGAAPRCESVWRQTPAAWIQSGSLLKCWSVGLLPCGEFQR